MKTVLGGLLAILAGLTLIFGLNYFGYMNVAFFAPKYEGVRRDVMIESRYYSEATIRELYRMKRQYASAQTQAERDTIRAAALHEFSIFPEDRLPVDLRAWFSAINR